MFKESKIVFFKPVAFKSAAYWRTVDFKVMYTSVLQALWEYLVRGGVLLNPDIYLAFPVFTNLTLFYERLWSCQLVFKDGGFHLSSLLWNRLFNRFSVVLNYFFSMTSKNCEISNIFYNSGARKSHTSNGHGRFKKGSYLLSIV